jgi:D-alanyl-lipoteichoic acid acyltransferase DltB (MBOAT superfamily)
VTFAGFFVVVLVASWALRPFPRAWRLLLLGASWVFYGWWDWRFVALLAVVIFANNLIATAMTRWPSRQKPWLVVGILVDLTVLGFFKYYGFFVSSALDLLRPLGLAPPLPLLEVVLPIGISFYILEAIAYLVEIRRGVVERMRLLDLAAYLSFFPKLMSGPITRPSEFGPQLDRPMPAADLDASRAFWLIGRGLVKKLVIATYLAEAIVDGVFATPGQYSALEVLTGIYGYAAQIYVDFSAYTDMAIGIALLLGFRLPENFRSPYAATSVHNFWNRWHMSLSRWLRDFLYQPLVLHGSRGRLARLSALVLTMLLAGLWHGAAWTFVLWGGVHGLALATERLHRELRRGRGLPKPVDTWWRRARNEVLTFHFVAFAWVLFAADSVSGALDILSRLGSPGPAPAVTPLLVAVLLAVFAAQHIPERWSQSATEAFRRVGPVLQTAALGVLLLFVDALGPEGVPPFIYTRF